MGFLKGTSLFLLHCIQFYLIKFHGSIGIQIGQIFRINFLNDVEDLFFLLKNVPYTEYWYFVCTYSPSFPLSGPWSEEEDRVVPS